MADAVGVLMIADIPRKKPVSASAAIAVAAKADWQAGGDRSGREELGKLGREHVRRAI